MDIRQNSLLKIIQAEEQRNYEGAWWRKVEVTQDTGS